MQVRDTKSTAVAAGKPAAQVRERADPSRTGSVAAPMAGQVIDVKVKPGKHRALLLWVCTCAGSLHPTGTHVGCREPVHVQAL